VAAPATSWAETQSVSSKRYRTTYDTYSPAPALQDKHHHDLHARSLRGRRCLLDAITMDANPQAVDARTATMMDEA
jgi:hypothetical protein